MTDRVRGWCQARKMRYVSDEVPTCLPATVLRSMLKTFQHEAVNMGNEKDAESFRPYTKNGGRDHKSNHKTKAGLLRTVQQALDGLPEETWTVSEVDPENPYLQALQKPNRALKQRDGLAGTIEDQYFKPRIDDRNFESSWLTASQINAAVRTTTMSVKSFVFLGVYRPVPEATESLLKILAKKWNPRVKQKFAVVWNTATSERGSHWVTGLFFPHEKACEFFDSMGPKKSKANVPVLQQFKIVATKLANLQGFDPKQWMARYNRTAHQQKSEQCGMYSIWYILQRIVFKRSFDEIERHPFSDEEVCALRPVYFSKSHSRVHQALENQRRQLAREITLSTMGRNKTDAIELDE